METQDVLHLLLSRRTKILKSECRLSLSSQAGGTERGRICCCLKAEDSGLGICYCLFPHGPEDYKADEDPAIFNSVNTGRGLLGPNWKKELVNNPDCPRMCAYKLVTVKFKWWGLQNRVENFIHKQEKRIFTNFHRQLFCWIDKWVELNMEDIRRMEEETQKELEELRKQGQVRGTSAADE